MKNTHHAEMTELIIGRDLSWMDKAVVCEADAEEPQTAAAVRRRKKPKPRAQQAPTKRKIAHYGKLTAPLALSPVKPRKAKPRFPSTIPAGEK